MVTIKFSNVRSLIITDCEWKDLCLALGKGYPSYGCFDGARCSTCGAPLNPGEINHCTRTEMP